MTIETDFVRGEPPPVEYPLLPFALQYQENRALAIKKSEKEERGLKRVTANVLTLDKEAKIKAYKASKNTDQLEIQEQLCQISRDVRTIVASDPNLRTVDENTWISRQKIFFEGEEIQVAVSLSGISPKEARQVRMCPVGLDSCLEVTNGLGYTNETVKTKEPILTHELVSYPGTSLDVAFYRKLADAMMPQES